MNSTINFFSPVQLGACTLHNRIVMAPMTRLRAVGSIPNSLMATYYAQRASAGLLVTECTMVSPLSNGYINCPGIYSAEQVEGWKLVTQAVHAKGGKIFLQLWHSGRVGHSSLLNGELPVAPSAIAAQGTLHTPIGKVVFETPRALQTNEIPQIVEQFRACAENAMVAGFDGVELHGAFGYLIDQFLQDGSNQRSDEYGGSIENRPFYQGTIITNGGYDKATGNAILASGDADLVSFGKLFIANPDLPKRLEIDAKLNTPNPKTFYGQGDKDLEKGYTDYSFLELHSPLAI